MSTQTVEAYPLIRAVVENAWYAIHLAKDPAPPARADVWLRRSDDAAAEARCANEFSIKNVRATHAALDPAMGSALHDLYKRTIAFGGHPNERGVLVATTRTETGQAYTFEVALLTDRPLLIAAALKTAVEAGIGALKTFQLILPERFAIVGLDGDIDRLVGSANTTFRPYVTPQK